MRTISLLHSRPPWGLRRIQFLAQWLKKRVQGKTRFMKFIFLLSMVCLMFLAKGWRPLNAEMTGKMTLSSPFIQVTRFVVTISATFGWHKVTALKFGQFLCMSSMSLCQFCHEGRIQMIHPMKSGNITRCADNWIPVILSRCLSNIFRIGFN